MKRERRLEIHPGKDDQLYVTLVAANGETRMTSEGYKDIRDARKLVAWVRQITPGLPLRDYSNSNPSEVSG